MNGRRRSGFTLIELLVVISIVALLMAMLFPALSRARRQARAVVCQANTRQWGIIWSLYRNEHDGRFMRNLFPGLVRPNPDRQIRPEKLYLCPAATKCDMTGHREGQDCIRPGGKFTAWWKYIRQAPLQESEPDFWFFRSSYGGNTYTIAPREDQSFDQASDPACREAFAMRWNRNNVKRPSRIPLLFDCATTGSGSLDNDEPPAYEGDFALIAPGEPWERWHNTMRYACLDRHGNGSVSVAFVDGSSRRVGLKELWTLKWHTQYNRSGPWTKAGGVMPGDWPQWMRKFKDY